MKFSTAIKTFGLVCLLSAFSLACSTETRQEANNDFQQFSAWVEENAKRAETATEEEWNEMDAEYQRRAAEVETRSKDWDDKTKVEWDTLRERWQETAGKAETRFRDAEADTATATN